MVNGLADKHCALSPHSLLYAVSFLFGVVSTSIDLRMFVILQVNLYVGVGLLSLGYALRLGGWISLVLSLSSPLDIES